MEENPKTSRIFVLFVVVVIAVCFLFSKACAIVCKRSVFCWMAVKLVV